MSLTICVFCGARPGTSQQYATAAYALGTSMAQRNWRLIYGGGTVGLMGAVAQTMINAGGEVTGVIPQALLEREKGARHANELIITQTLRERKAIMDERADAFIALPGGFGTLEELLETLTLRQLGFHNKPIIVVNLENYYDPLLRLFVHATEQGFVGTQEMQFFDVVEGIDEAVARLEPLSQENQRLNSQVHPAIVED